MVKIENYYIETDMIQELKSELDLAKFKYNITNLVDIGNSYYRLDIESQIDYSTENGLFIWILEGFGEIYG